MPVLGNTVRRVRTSGSNVARTAQSPWWPWSSTATTAGPTASPAEALTVPSLLAALLVKAQTLGAFPIHVHERDAEGKRRTVRDEAERFLWGRPNPEVTRSVFWTTVFGHQIWDGNAFLFVVKSNGGEPLELWPIEPKRVRVGRLKDGRKIYELDQELPMLDFTLGGEIVHVPGFSRNGMLGLNLIEQMAQSVGLAKAAEEYGGKFFKQAPNPSGLLTSEQVINQEQAEALAARWDQRHSGANALRTAVLGSGAKWQAVSISPEQSQLIEVLKFRESVLLRPFLVPPHIVGDVERSTSWGSGIEEQNRNFQQFGLQPHYIAFEQALDGAFLEKRDRYVKFDPSGLLRGNTLQQYQAFRVALGGHPFATVNEVRALLDMEPIEGGDEMKAPVNMGAMDGEGGGNSSAEGSR